MPPSPTPPTTFAVVLCGCGRADGSEITESVSTIIHLSRTGTPFRCFAPSENQAEVVNHLTGKPTTEHRSMLVEAARIARGEVSPLAELHPEQFAGVIFPGGFGAAKNLCTFAKDGAACTVHPQVERVIKAFHAARKPIGLICIAPVIAARVLGTKTGGPGCTVTIGTDEATARAITSMGAANVGKQVSEVHVDDKNRLVTTPAYMCDAAPHEVFGGIGHLVDKVVAMARA